MQIAPKIKAYKLPLNISIVFHTTKSVSAPNRAGKNLTQKGELPSNIIR